MEIFDKIKKQNALLCKFQKKLKGDCFIVEEIQIINISEAVKIYQYVQNIF